MGRHPIRTTARALGNDEGSVAIVFALMLVVLVFAAGVGLDFSRVMHTRAGLVSAADAAALAAGRALSDGNRTDSEIRSVAQAFFRENIGGSNAFGDIGTLEVAIDRDAGTVKVDVTADVPMTLTRIAGYESMHLPVTATTATSSRDIELAMVLDVTGSMSGSKIAALRAAATNLVEQVLSDQNRRIRARVALAPYAASVNAGAAFEAATGRRSGTGCVIERSDATRFTDAAPGSGTYLGYSRSAACPSTAVQPLTEDKAALTRQIQALGANGQTAGHIGTAWGWYLVSPLWSGVWPAESRPAAYDKNRTLKAVLLMTDGEFNTAYVGANGSSSAQARALCTNMKDEGVVIYTVAFMANSAAETLLRACASSSSHYFPASSSDALAAAFQAVGRSLTQLHLTQ